MLALGLLAAAPLSCKDKKSDAGQSAEPTTVPATKAPIEAQAEATKPTSTTLVPTDAPQPGAEAPFTLVLANGTKQVYAEGCFFGELIPAWNIVLPMPGEKGCDDVEPYDDSHSGSFTLGMCKDEADSCPLPSVGQTFETELYISEPMATLKNPFSAKVNVTVVAHDRPNVVVDIEVTGPVEGLPESKAEASGKRMLLVVGDRAESMLAPEPWK